jgi:hypothetical protein
MKDPVAQALDALAQFAAETDSNTAMVDMVKKVQAVHESQTNAWREAEAARRDAESTLETVCQLLKIKPGELIP